MVSEVSIHDERIMVPVPGVILIESKSEPGTWHHTTPSSCDCKGFEHRGKCRHIATLQKIVETAIEQTQAVEVERKARIAETVDLIWPE